MNEEEKREQMIGAIADILRTTSFSLEYQVKKKPTGVKIIVEVSQEDMDILTQQALKQRKKKQHLLANKCPEQTLNFKDNETSGHQ